MKLTEAVKPFRAFTVTTVVPLRAGSGDVHEGGANETLKSGPGVTFSETRPPSKSRIRIATILCPDQHGSSRKRGGISCGLAVDDAKGLPIMVPLTVSNVTVPVRAGPPVWTGVDGRGESYAGALLNGVVGRSYGGGGAYQYNFLQAAEFLVGVAIVGGESDVPPGSEEVMSCA